MAVTENSYTGNGSTTNYSFTFPYLKSTDVQVQVDAAVTTAWTFANATTVQFNTAPSSGAKIKILRDTNVDSLAATFYAGSSIKSEDLNDNYTQNLYKTQEVGNRYFSNTGGTMTGDLTLGEDVELIFEGATDDAHETKLTVADPTADRTITLPNVSGTVITTGDTGTVAHAMLAGDAVDGDNIADDSINSEHYVDGSIDTQHIADSQITTAKIADNNVTTAKIVDGNITTAKLAADAVNGTKIADDSINSEHYVDGSIDTQHIADNQITTAKIVNDAVTADKLANTSVTAGTYSAADITVDAQGRVTAASSGAIATSEITDSAVTTAKLGADSVTGAKIADDQINSEHYVDGSIDTAHIADAQITTAKIVDANVTHSKLANDAVDGDNIVDNAINSEHYVDGSIDHVHLANDVIDGDNIQDNVINSEHYVDGSIDTAHIANLQVTRDKIANDAVNATKIADDSIDSEHYVDGSIDTAHLGNTQVTDAKLASNAVTTSKITDANVTTDKIANDAITIGKIGCEQTTISDSDSHIPTSGAVVDYVAAQIAPIGGLEVIATEVAFPNTQPSAGVVISIADAGGIVVNGSGTSTTGRTVGGSTVTINNINSAFNSSTVDAGVSFMVSSTGSGQVYNFHKATLKEADILNLSNDINDFGNRYRVASSAPTSSLDNGDLWFDTTNGKMMVYNTTNTAWEEVSAIGSFNINTLSSSGNTGGGSATFNGTAYRFTLSNPPQDAQQLLVSINGVIQKPNTGSSQPSEGFAISGNDIIFSAAPASGSSSFIITLGQSVQIGSPSDGSVTTAKLVSGAVTTAKIADDAVTGAKIATNLDLPDNNKIRFGTGNDLQIYHDGANTGIINTTGGLYIRNNGAIFLETNNGESSVKCVANDNVELYFDNAKKLQTTSGGIYVTGDIDAGDSSKIKLGGGDDLQFFHNGSDSIIRHGNATTGNDLYIQSDTKTIFGSVGGAETHAVFNDDGAVELYYNNSKKFDTVDGGTRVFGYISMQGTGGHIYLPDSAQLKIGSGEDLKIFHDGGNSYIQDTGTGSLRVTGDSIILLDNTNSEKFIEATANGSVDLYYDNSKKFETTSSGVKVVNLQMDDSSQAIFGTGEDLKIWHDGTDSHIKNSNNSGELKIRSHQTDIKNADNNETQAIFHENGAVELYYDGTKKFETRSGGAAVFGHLELGDNDKVLLGDSNDIQIYHDGSSSYLLNENGQLTISSDNALNLASRTGTEYFFRGYLNGAAELYYDNSKKFHTNAGGCQVFGNLFAGDNAKHYFGDGNDLEIYHDGTNSAIVNSTGNLEINATASEVGIRVVPNGSVDLFYNNVEVARTIETDSLKGFLVGNDANINTSVKHGEFIVRKNLGSPNNPSIYQCARMTLITNEQTAGGNGYGGALFFGGQDVDNASQYTADGAAIGATMNNSDLANANGSYMLDFYTRNGSTFSHKFRIEPDGDLLGTDTSISSLSDSRLKENIEDFTFDINKFKKFQPKTFNWKHPEYHRDTPASGKHRGFIAQDLESIDSELVSTYRIPKDNPEAALVDQVTLEENEKKDVVSEGKVANLGRIDAMYISVINQLIAKVETLEAKVATLEAK